MRVSSCGSHRLQVSWQVRITILSLSTEMVSISFHLDLRRRELSRMPQTTKECSILSSPWISWKLSLATSFSSLAPIWKKERFKSCRNTWQTRVNQEVTTKLVLTESITSRFGKSHWESCCCSNPSTWQRHYQTLWTWLMINQCQLYSTSPS